MWWSNMIARSSPRRAACRITSGENGRISQISSTVSVGLQRFAE